MERTRPGEDVRTFGRLSDGDLDRFLSAMPEPRHIEDGDLLAFRAGRLAPDAADEVQAHLGTCAFCQGLLGHQTERVPRRLTRWAERRLAPRGAGWAWMPFGGLAAAAAAVVLVVIGFYVGDFGRGSEPTVAPTPAYELSAVEGGVKHLRGEDAPASALFLPESRLRVDLLPKSKQSASPPLVRVFTSDAGGPLVAAPPEALETGEGGAFRVEARGRELFGERPGAKTLVIVLGRDRAELSELAGLPLSAVRERLAVERRFEVAVDYRMGIEDDGGP